MKITEYVALWLAKNNIKYVFSVTGGGSAALNDAISKTIGVEIVYCHNEQAAAIAAEAYFRFSGEIAVCLVTQGPGSTNTYTGVICAWMDSIPMIILSGQSFSNQMVGDSKVRQRGIQEFNNSHVVPQFVKYFKSLSKPEDIILELNNLLIHSIKERGGPVWLEIPADIQNISVDIDNTITINNSIRESKKYNFQEKLINELNVMISKSTRPLIHFGNGIRGSEAFQGAKDFIEKHKIPYILTHNSLDLFESKDPLNLGFSGLFGIRSANFALEACDLYISIGARLDFAQTGYETKQYAKNAFRVMVDIDENEIAKNSHFLDSSFNCDSKDFFSKIEELKVQFLGIDSNWSKICQEWKVNYTPIKDQIFSSNSKVNAYRFIEELSTKLNKANIVTDMGLSYQSTYQGIKIKSGIRLQTNTGFAPMGWGLPASIGAAKCDPKTLTLCITGDGGIMMNIQELSTIRHHNLPIKIFLYFNKGYLTIKQTQESSFNSNYTGVDADSGLSFPEFAKVFEGFGIESIEVQSNSEISGAVDWMLNDYSPKLCVLHMDLNHRIAPRIIPNKKSNTELRIKGLINQWPYLDEDLVEYEISRTRSTKNQNG